MPFPGEHSCRLHDPGKYVRFRRQNGIGEVDGKPLDAIIGFKEGGGSEVQSFRYRTAKGWNAGAARSHCGDHDGSFEAASGEDELTMMNIQSLEEEIRSNDLEALESYKHGIAPAPILYKAMGYAKESKEGPLVFVASEESEDRVGDIIVAEGWQFDEFKKNPAFLFAHDHSIPPIGYVSKVWIDEKQLLDTIHWDEGDEFAKFVKGKYERKMMRAQSVGFRPIEWEERKDTTRGILFKKTELLEISAVSIPAHPHALAKALGNKRFTIVMPAIAEIKLLDQDVPLDKILISLNSLKE